MYLRRGLNSLNSDTVDEIFNEQNFYGGWANNSQRDESLPFQR